MGQIGGWEEIVVFELEAGNSRSLVVTTAVTEESPTSLWLSAEIILSLRGDSRLYQLHDRL